MTEPSNEMQANVENMNGDKPESSVPEEECRTDSIEAEELLLKDQELSLTEEEKQVGFNYNVEQHMRATLLDTISCWLNEWNIGDESRLLSKIITRLALRPPKFWKASVVLPKLLWKHLSNHCIDGLLLKHSNHITIARGIFFITWVKDSLI